MAEGQRGIDVRTLNMQQLQSVRKNLVEEVQMLVGGLQQLKVAQSKLLQAQESVDAIKPENKGKDIMMPLTGSMYVPAKLDSIESVMVELGTGYFVEKTPEDATAFFKRRVEYITDQMKMLQEQAVAKKKTQNGVEEVIATRIQELRAAQQSRK